MSGVFVAIESELSLLPVSAQGSWFAELARTLARSLDDQPNASLARELRSLMKDISDSSALAGAEVDLGDDLARRRADRIARASGS
jgi:hypothetical protein